MREKTCEEVDRVWPGDDGWYWQTVQEADGEQIRLWRAVRALMCRRWVAAGGADDVGVVGRGE